LHSPVKKLFFIFLPTRLVLLLLGFFCFRLIFAGFPHPDGGSWTWTIQLGGVKTVFVAGNSDFAFTPFIVKDPLPHDSSVSLTLTIGNLF